MRKLMTIISILVLGLLLTACMDPSIENLDLVLNPGIDTIELYDDFNDAGATASYGFKNLDVEVISNNVDTTQVGVYEIVYQVTYETLVKTITRKVTVVDELRPMAVINPGLDTIFVGDTWIDQGVTSNETVEVTVSGYVDHLNPGEYIITYLIKDQKDNELILYRYVNVIER